MQTISPPVTFPEEDSIPLRQLASSSAGNGTQQDGQPNVPAAPSVPPKDGGRAAWTFLAAATTMEALIWGMGNSYGSFQDFHLSSPASPLYGQPSAISSAVGTLITAGQYFAPFLFSGFVAAYPHRLRLFSTVCLVISSLSLAVVSFHPTAASLVALQGFVSGWAGGAAYLPAIAYLPEYFDKKRGLATGIIFCGSGVGGVFLPFVISAMLSKSSFAWTLRYLALIQLVLGGMTAAVLKPRIPYSDMDSTSPSAGPMPSRPRRKLLRALLPVHSTALHSTLGLLIISLQFLQGAAYRSVAFYISPYASSLGVSNLTATAVLATFNAASTISYIVTGGLLDHLHYGLLILLINTIAMLLCGTLFGFATSLAPLLAFACLYGGSCGGFSTTLSPIARQVAARSDPSDTSPVFMEVLAWRGVGGLVGPLISAALYKPMASSSSVGKTVWSAKAIYGAHGIGPVVIFTTVLSGVVALLSLFTVNFRSNRLVST